MPVSAAGGGDTAQHFLLPPEGSAGKQGRGKPLTVTEAWADPESD